MTDIGKKIESLSLLRERLKLQKDILGYGLHIDDLSSAIALLKEQEPKMAIVTWQNRECKDGECPTCGHEIDTIMHPKYCGYCGQAVEWND